MFYEMRTYRLKVGALPKYLQLVQETGLSIQRSHLGQLIGYFHTEIGPLNQIVHIWAFESLDDRECRRNALAADPAWQAFTPALQALIDEMESKVLRPAAFSPLS
jgi:hypothetical protein